MHAGHPQKLHHLPDSSQGPCLASDLISPNVTTKKHPSYNKPIFLYKKKQFFKNAEIFKVLHFKIGFIHSNQPNLVFCFSLSFTLTHTHQQNI